MVQPLKHTFNLPLTANLQDDFVVKCGRRQKFSHALFLQNNKSFLFLHKNVQKWNGIKQNGNKQKNVKMSRWRDKTQGVE